MEWRRPAAKRDVITASLTNVLAERAMHEGMGTDLHLPRKKWRRTIAAMLVTVAAVSTTARASAETLADALVQAYSHNPTLGAARYDVRAQDETVVQARSELRPTATLQVTGGYQRSQLGRASRNADPFTPGITGSPDDTGDVIIDQPIYTGGKASADRRVAEANVHTAREGLRSAEGDLMLAVITAYMDVQSYTDSLDIYRSSVAELERIETEIEARRKAGDLTITDVAQATAQLEIARQQLVTTEQDLESARADYTQLVGHAPGDLAEAPGLAALPPTIDLAYELAEKQNPDLAQARYTESASRETIAATRASGRPTLRLHGEASINGNDYPYRLYNQDKTYAGSVVLTVPITAGGLIQSEVDEARERNGGDQFRVEAERRQVIRDTTVAWNAIVSADRRLKLLALQETAATTQLNGMIKEYRAGFRSTFDVLYAQQQLHDAQVAGLGSYRDYYVADATLLRRLGLLEVGTILASVPLYDPTTHLNRIKDRNAWVPWTPVVGAIDKVGSGAPRSKALVYPQDPITPLMVRPGSTGPNADAPLARSVPTTPSETAPIAGGRLANPNQTEQTPKVTRPS
jgi:outer membrane protein